MARIGGVAQLVVPVDGDAIEDPWWACGSSKGHAPGAHGGEQLGVLVDAAKASGTVAGYRGRCVSHCRANPVTKRGL